MKPAEDPSHKGNSAEYHTGKPCIVKGCKEPAGTWWGTHWCQKHNAVRLDQIGSTLETMAEKAALREAVEKETASLRELLYKAYAENRALIVAAGGKITVLPEHRKAKIISQSCRTPQGLAGPATYDYMIERKP